MDSKGLGKELHSHKTNIHLPPNHWVCVPETAAAFQGELATWVEETWRNLKAHRSHRSPSSSHRKTPGSFAIDAKEMNSSIEVISHVCFAKNGNHVFHSLEPSLLSSGCLRSPLRSGCLRFPHVPARRAPSTFGENSRSAKQLSSKKRISFLDPRRQWRQEEIPNSPYRDVKRT